MRCQNCAGSGKVMGGGMLIEDCRACDGVGVADIKPSKEEIAPVMDKRSKGYRNAIKKLMDSGLSKADAEEEFEKAYDAL